MTEQLFKTESIVFEIGSYPFRLDKGITVTAIGHHCFEEFSRQLHPYLQQWGFEGSLEISPSNIKHDHRTCRNALDISKLMAMNSDSAMLPVTLLVDYRIPVFGYFAKGFDEA